MSECGAFAIGMTGRSAPEFLSTLPSSFEEAGVKSQWHKWHVFLADERCVVSDHDDPNIKNEIDQFLHRSEKAVRPRHIATAYLNFPPVLPQHLPQLQLLHLHTTLQQPQLLTLT